ncbi:hypothetical protein [Saccharopolyspora sp. ASAGF58]|uniref:hypothetical protein n=1 Tax=Saccharopolyspora sp. ASAGF58 TaxID=2719023 RepID=UPI00143FE87E|nr:hypothetical protein [Saccharopolyspora sp. ASAGF58]QIZ33665.1 hypothetical protein FDZ84_01635 [Saccharopolyspora sp. ASAGF58]
MQARSRLVRWGLLVVLALGVVLMHHMPAQHHESHPPAAPAAAAMHAGMPTEHSEPPAAAAMHAGMPTERRELPAAPDHGLLHLCLAIAAGFIALLLPVLHRIASALAGTPKPLAITAFTRFRPPTPVPRRLAMLCVLRR